TSGSTSASPAGSATSAAESTWSSWCARSRATGCCSRPTRRTSRRATCGRSPRRGATSPPSCRISFARWRAPSGGRPRKSPPTPPATPAPSSACMNLVHLLLRSARWQPDRPALAVGKRPVRTYREMASRVAKLASGLTHQFNLKKHDRVALAMRNCPEFYEILFACWHAGITAVPMNAKLHPKEFAYILENSGAKLCFVTPDLQSAVPNGFSIENLQQLFLEPTAPADVEPDDVAWLFYTSGTTGVPKGAMLTHRNMLFQTHAYFADIDKLAPGDSALHPAPLSHGSGLYGLPHF